MSVDPLTASYPWYTPYQFAGNMPIWAIDLDGLEEWTTNNGPIQGPFASEFKAEEAAQAHSFSKYGFAFQTSEQQAYSYHKNNTEEYLGKMGAYERGEMMFGVFRGVKEGALDIANAYYTAQLVYIPGAVYKGLTSLPKLVSKTKIKNPESLQIIDDAFQNPNLSVSIAETADDINYMTNSMQAEALFMEQGAGRGSMLLKANADLPTVLEEVIHFNQLLKHGNKNFIKNRVLLEIEAQDELIRIGTKEKWGTEVLDRIKSAKKYWENLSNGKSASGT